ncbi:hypothetical protein Tco_0020373 [Tanacetum coccineum]
MLSISLHLSANDNNPFVAPPSSDIVIKQTELLEMTGPRHLKNLKLTGCTGKEEDHSSAHFKCQESILNTLRFVRKDGREIFYMAIPDALLTDEIKRAPYYGDYQEHVAKYQQFWMQNVARLRKEEQHSLLMLPRSLNLRQLSDKGVPVEKPAYTNEEADLQWALELKVQGKGKEKVVDEQVAYDLLTLQTLTKKIPIDQFIFQRRPPMPTKPTGHADSPSLDTELALTNSETKSDEEVPMSNTGDQDEGQAGPNPGEQDKGQAGPNPESQPQPSHVVHVGPNLEHMDVEATDASTQQKPEQMDEEFTTTAYPNVQENLKLPTEDQVILEEPASSTGTLSSLQNLEKDLSFTDQFFVEKPHEEESRKTNAETEVQSMVSVPIHQDTFSVPPMTTLVIDLTTMQSDSPLPTSTTTTSIITTITSLPPPPQP